VSEPLVHVSGFAVSVLEGPETPIDSRTRPWCGADFKGAQTLTGLDAVGILGAAAPTCPKCRIAWDTAVEKAGGAR
jgi:hypothetical protein